MVGIISNSAALFAQTNLERAALESQSSIARLSSGQSIIRASDDVAGLAIGTVLGTNVTTLRTALTSTSQASSLLQLADGGAKNIADILQRQKALAVQANSGTLSNNERAFLNEEFQSLADQINQTVLSTKFNTVSLIDGSIFDKADVTTNTADIGTAASATITLTGGDIADGDTININGVGVVFTDDGAGNTVEIVAGDEDATINNLVEFINNSDNVALQAVSASGDLANDIVTLTARENGVAGNSIDLSDASAGGGTNFTVTSFAGGIDGDLVSGDVSFGSSDVVGDGILAALSTTAPARASQTIALTTISSGDTITINGVTFTFGTTATTHIGFVGATDGDAELLIRAFEESGEAALDGISLSYDVAGDVLTISADAEGSALNGATLTNGFTGAVLSDVTLGGPLGTVGAGDSGIAVNDITNNASFVGTISGFEATYVADNQVTLEVTIGDQVYTATVADTDPSANSFVRFTSTETGAQGGGTFDIILAANQGEAVTNQSDANLFASRLDLAFSSVNFYQDRDVADSSYVGAGDIYVGSTQTGSLSGSSVEFNISDFSQAQIADLSVTAPALGSSDGEITITLANGDVFTTDAHTVALGDVIADGTAATLVNENNPNESIVITFGTIGIDGTDAVQFQTNDQAQALQDALKGAFGLGEGGGGLDFQVGLNLDDTIKVAIGDLSTDTLYRDASGVTQTLDISTAAGAQEASDVLDLAINRLTTERANIGALQSRFSFASAGITTSIQNTEAARSDFLDVDIAEESTSFATAQVRLQASISVLAQANQLPQNLLKLLG